MLERRGGGGGLECGDRAESGGAEARAGAALRDAGGGKTLPRHLHRFVLGLLLPAEAAARRLVIAAARGMVVEVPPQREPGPDSIGPWLCCPGVAVTPSHADGERAEGERQAAPLGAARPRVLSLSLFDPLERPFRVPHRDASADAAQRFPSLDFEARLPPPPSPDDPLSTARLMLRLDALGRALDDLPAQARRFARWKARRDEALAREQQGGAVARGEPGGAAAAQDKTRDAAGAQDNQGHAGATRSRRILPLKTGRPPGWRRKTADEVHAVLNAVHQLALSAPEAPDTS
ncbi:hypothetical protein [Mesorhizobium sp. IMUNJ 23232]|uniref:hypothetical protein n=1 Tax=Mesorhizobium sp. IMUNJ 23232 TaxID=3376064 RepID=UPI0037BDE4BA